MVCGPVPLACGCARASLGLLAAMEEARVTALAVVMADVDRLYLKEFVCKKFVDKQL